MDLLGTLNLRLCAKKELPDILKFLQLLMAATFRQKRAHPAICGYPLSVEKTSLMVWLHSTTFEECRRHLFGDLKEKLPKEL